MSQQSDTHMYILHQSHQLRAMVHLSAIRLTPGRMARYGSVSTVGARGDPCSSSL